MLYTDYVYYFQAAGLILLVAMIGAIVLTLRHRPASSARTSPRRSRRTPATAIEIDARSSRGRGRLTMTIGLGHYLTVAAILFTLGIFGIFLNRKNVIVILMSIELILLAVNINFVAFSRLPRRPGRPGVRAVRADGRGGRGRDRARHPRRLLPQPRLDRGRRHQHDEGLSGMYQAIVFLPLLGAISRPISLGARSLGGDRSARSSRACRPSAPCGACAHDDHHAGWPLRGSRAASCHLRCCSSAICPGSRSAVGFGSTTSHACCTWIDVGRPRGRLGAPHRHADRGDAGGGDDRVGARAPLFDRLHGTTIRTGRASSPICRCSPSPC